MAEKKKKRSGFEERIHQDGGAGIEITRGGAPALTKHYIQPKSASRADLEDAAGKLYDAIQRQRADAARKKKK